MSESADGTLDGERLLGDTGFRQPPPDSPEPVGDVDNAEDMPDLENVRESPVASDHEEAEEEEAGKGEVSPLEKREEEELRASAEPKESDEKAKDLEQEELKEAKESEEPKTAGEKRTEPLTLSKEQRKALFMEGRNLEASGQLDEALEKFTAALSGVRPETAFPELPACLRALAEVYYKREEYEKAVHFIQAEKMYYEAALLDTSVLQSILNKDVKQSLIKDTDDSNLQKLRANEYETLSRFCVDKKELQLALEYAAKAAKLRETVYGPDHEETTRSFDLLTSIYADLGKQEYAECLEKFERSKQEPSASPPSQQSLPTPPSNAAGGQPQGGENFEREVRISIFFFAVMVFIAFSVLTCVSAYAYCQLVVSPVCESATTVISEQLNWLHYLVHTWLP